MISAIDCTSAWTMPNTIFKAEEPELQIVWGEVYAPDRPDAQGEFMRADQIRKMAHDFIADGKMKSVDVMHDNKLVNACIVESFIARDDDNMFIPGSWVVGMHVADPNLWAAIKKGDINGFSMEALVTRHAQEFQVVIPPMVTGHTSAVKTDTIQKHEHRFFISYGDQGEFRGGVTDEVLGHVHKIVAGTHTETTLNHRHLFSSVDDVKVQ